MRFSFRIFHYRHSKFCVKLNTGWPKTSDVRHACRRMQTLRQLGRSQQGSIMKNWSAFAWSNPEQPNGCLSKYKTLLRMSFPAGCRELDQQNRENLPLNSQPV